MRFADTVLFDLDGTLTDPAEGILNSFVYAMEKMGFAHEEKYHYTRVIGPPLLDSFREICGLDEEGARKGVMLYREYFSAGGMFENRVYPGIPVLLEKARKAGYRLGVATSKPDRFSEAILKKFDLWPYFDFLAASTMDEKRTAKEEVIAYAMKIHGVKAENTLMVGDRKYDIIGAHTLGMRAVGVSYGYGSEEELKEAGADHIAHSVEELAVLLQLA